VNDFLVRYLGSIDADLLDYLDDDEELSIDVARRLRDGATSLLGGDLTPRALAEQWSDWFHLVSAFVAAYGWEGTDELEQSAPLFVAVAEGETQELTRADREFLEAIELQLDLYPSEFEPQ
jgi:hypothetical protein